MQQLNFGFFDFLQTVPCSGKIFPFDFRVTHHLPQSASRIIRWSKCCFNLSGCWNYLCSRSNGRAFSRKSSTLEGDFSSANTICWLEILCLGCADYFIQKAFNSFPVRSYNTWVIRAFSASRLFYESKTEPGFSIENRRIIKKTYSFFYI